METYRVVVEVAGERHVAFSGLPYEKAKQYRDVLADPENLNPQAIVQGVNHTVELEQ